jgi:hypothetical protein
VEKHDHHHPTALRVSNTGLGSCCELSHFAFMRFFVLSALSARSRMFQFQVVEVQMQFI